MKLARILPRFTVRRLMVIVAIVAVGIGGMLEYRRLRELSRQYSVKAGRMGWYVHFYRDGERQSHEEWLRGREEVLEMHRKSGFMAAYPPEPEKCRQLIPHYESLQLKYEWAARYPFLPIVPDPTPPLLK